MTEITPVTIPCSAEHKTYASFMIRPNADRVEILAHPMMTVTPQDARKAALATLAIADRAEGLKTFCGPYEALEALVEAAQALIDGARWTRDEASSTPEVIITPAEVTALRTALEAFADES